MNSSQPTNQNKDVLDSSQENEEMLDLDSMFEEPKEFYKQAREDYFSSYAMKTTDQQIKLRIVGDHVLWGNYLWNASIVLAEYLETHTELVANQTVLELGAAAGLPSMVIVTDYPDNDLVENLNINSKTNFSELVEGGRLVATGFVWGKDPSLLTKYLLEDQKCFDMLILSDLVFNHSEHRNLLTTCKQLIRKPIIGKDGEVEKTSGNILVFFSHHRPWLADKDVDFFNKAKDEFGFKVEKILEKYTGPMFENDPGDEKVRGTVHGYLMTC
ncbi:Protein N-methyltransferase nnt1 [Smittium culicis]|uniref:Protein N-methyltransferase nnt1 n=1 Tax=Smittium culicis TaxID=133412 RepID=A0A1R1YM77_9FUNG|nr:Protein N-methyltransferase nnt1 [Smittium culicis]